MTRARASKRRNAGWVVRNLITAAAATWIAAGCAGPLVAQAPERQSPAGSCPISPDTRRFSIENAEPRGPLERNPGQFVVAPIVPYGTKQFVPYDAARSVGRVMDRLNVDVLARRGFFQGVAFYVDAAERGEPEYLFFLDEPSCRLQAYMELSCVAMDTPSLFISIGDASGNPLASVPRVRVRDDRGFEEVQNTGDFRGVVERPGSYEILIEASGYHPWRASGITVPPGGCGGQMVFLVVDLFPVVD